MVYDPNQRHGLRYNKRISRRLINFNQHPATDIHTHALQVTNLMSNEDDKYGTRLLPT